MDDLDALLEDLGRPKSTNVKKQARAPSSRVDLNELEDLMSDLAAPSKPAPKPVASVPKAVATNPNNGSFNASFNSGSNGSYGNNSRPVSVASSDSDDLDSLMASLNNTPSRTSVAVPAPKVVNKPAPAFTPAPVSTPTPSPVKSSAPTTMDDLDELLNNLEPSRPASVYKPAPVQQSRNAPAPAPVPAPAYKYEPPSQPVPEYQTRAAPVVSGNFGGSSNSPKSSFNNGNSFGNNSNTFGNSGNSFNSNVTTRVVPPSKTPLAGDDLDNLLTNLTGQMNDIDGNSPSSRGNCATCRKPILGEVIQALGKTFHPEHFVCGNCQNPLGTANFYEQDGLPNCERCYQELFCARCAHCDEPILDRCITALGKKWHMNHFICTQCLKPFEGGSFFERDSRPYCEGCFHSVFAARCAGCNQSIKGECVNAIGQQWHPEHFVCQYCQKSFGGGTFFEFGGKPYCETHYHQQTGSLCAGCGKAITGRCVNALDKKWHPEHFVCAFCMNALAGGSFTENNGKAYCRDCHGKLFG